MSGRRYILVGVGFGILAGLLAYFHIASLKKDLLAGQRLVGVLVARGYIPAGEVLKDSLVYVSKIPHGYVQPAALAAIKDLLTERGDPKYVTLLSIAEGEQILSSKLAAPGREGGLSAILPLEKVAVAVSMNKVKGAGGFIRPGDLVDVLWTARYEASGGGENSGTVTMLQAVPVFGVGRWILGGAPPKKEEEEQEEQVITLILNQVEAQTIAFARENGSLSLSLRPVGSTLKAALPQISVASLISGAKSVSGAAGKEEVPEYIKNIEKQTREALRSMKQHVPASP